MSEAHLACDVDWSEFSNHNVFLRESENRGRGLFARTNIEADTHVLSAPVKVLNAMEYEILRLLPAIRDYLKQTGLEQFPHTLGAFSHGLQQLLLDPEKVLSAAGGQETSTACIMHTFSWPAGGDDACNTAAIAFGLVSLCNHADDAEAANARIERRIERDRLDLIATRNIAAGEEILIRYLSTPFAEEN